MTLTVVPVVSAVPKPKTTAEPPSFAVATSVFVARLRISKSKPCVATSRNYGVSFMSFAVLRGLLIGRIVNLIETTTIINGRTHLIMDPEP
jgi:hypothetical protein